MQLTILIHFMGDAVGRYCEGGEQCLQTSLTFLCFTQKLLCGCPSTVSWLQHRQELGKLDHPNVFEIVKTFKKEQEVHGTACCWSCTSSSPGRSFRETARAPKNQESKIKPARSNRVNGTIHAQPTSSFNVLHTIS